MSLCISNIIDSYTKIIDFLAEIKEKKESSKAKNNRKTTFLYFVPLFSQQIRTLLLYDILFV
jgi:hypothetical protein